MATPAHNGHDEPQEREARGDLGTVNELAGDLRERVERRPYLAVGLGFAAGFILGGGLTPRLAMLLVGTAGRAAVMNALTGSVRRGLG